MTKTTRIRNRGGEEQVTLQTATARVIHRLGTQGMYGASATAPTRGVNLRDFSREMVSQAAGGRSRWQGRQSLDPRAQDFEPQTSDRGVANPATRGQDPGQGNTLNA